MKRRNGWTVFGILFAAVGMITFPAIPGIGQDAPLDLVILHGRVMDPESGLDAVRNVGVRGGKIVEITEAALQGREVIDAKGLVVAPGFIDPHEHGQEPRNYQFQAHDGVTTSLELEAGTDDVAAWYAHREGKSLINYGVSVGHIPVRTDAMLNRAPGSKELTEVLKEASEASHRVATPQEIARMQNLI